VIFQNFDIINKFNFAGEKEEEREREREKGGAMLVITFSRITIFPYHRF